MLFFFVPMAHAQDRDVLPALPVERAVLVPRGWTLLELEGEHLRAEDLVRDALAFGLRYGAARRVEFRLELPLVRADLDGNRAWGPGDPAFGLAFSLARSEVANRSLALDLTVRGPLGAAPHGVPLGPGVLSTEAALAGGVAAGPLLATLRIGGGLDGSTLVAWTASPLDPGDRWFAEPALLLQAGPLSAWVDADGVLRGATVADGRTLDPGGPEVDGRAGLGLQLNRAIGLRAWLGRALVGSAPLHPAAPRGRTAGLSIEVGA